MTVHMTPVSPDRLRNVKVALSLWAKSLPKAVRKRDAKHIRRAIQDTAEHLTLIESAFPDDHLAPLVRALVRCLGLPMRNGSDKQVFINEAIRCRERLCEAVGILCV